MLFHRLLAGGIGVLAAVAGVAPAAAQTAAPAYTYVAVGDSVAAGVGAPPYLDPECLRSSNGYPTLLASTVEHGAASRSEACAGATTMDVVSGQLSSLSRQTRLVTVTVGGNDLEFSSRMATCMQGTDADCTAVVEAAQAFTTGQLRGRLDGVYRAVRQRAPRAEIVATGYPRFFETTADCAAVPPASLVKRKALNETVDLLNRVIAGQARRAGARFADVQPRFTAHGLCGADPWITGLTDAGAFHPTAVGYRAGYLPALRKAIDCRR
ncbi:SGNH/GDSL hydrolase family protein [Paractinoplanes hotanensis]|uniref:SGNH/GDSL hydrolase family protein n=1 Tax=Paractinoplanes hotanensis TaxID=2906497 RepID=A0ABT0YEW8_9ACTN|nr:SGNH/GDSL hydrolase family protein [Actinoplanes hotanensis]MCM4084290.1 SGNH/GDSL hydrolase family protein [Actinoplanes hotanensis]